LNRRGAEVIKSLSGGDPLSGELKGKNGELPIEGNFNIVITSNKRLRACVDEDNDAYRRRLKIVLFKCPARRENPNLAEEIIASEASGVINWGLQGLLVLENDFEEHGSWQLTAEQWQRIDDLLMESDSLRAYLKDGLAPDPTSNVTSNEIILAYNAYCQEKGWQAQPDSVAMRLIPALIPELFGVARSNDIRRNGGVRRGYRGLRLEDETYANDPDGVEFYVPDRL